MCEDTIQGKYHRACIFMDSYYESPRDFDVYSTLATWHRRYALGDVQPDIPPKQYMKEQVPRNAIWRTVYMLDHSGLALSLSDFHDPWDSGPIGFIWHVPEKGELEEQIIQRFEGELEEYQAYLNGEVYGCRIIDDREHIVETYSMIFGYQAVRDTAKRELDYYDSRREKETKNAKQGSLAMA